MARGGLTRRLEGREGSFRMGLARGEGDHEMDEWHEKGIGRARAQRSGARYRNRCARNGVGGDGARGLTRSREGRKGFLGGWRIGWDHEMDEWHGKGRLGRTRTQRSGTRTQRSGTRFDGARRSARELRE